MTWQRIERISSIKAGDGVLALWESPFGLHFAEGTIEERPRKDESSAIVFKLNANNRIENHRSFLSGFRPSGDASDWVLTSEMGVTATGWFVMHNGRRRNSYDFYRHSSVEDEFPRGEESLAEILASERCWPSREQWAAYHQREVEQRNWQSRQYSINLSTVSEFIADEELVSLQAAVEEYSKKILDRLVKLGIKTEGYNLHHIPDELLYVKFILGGQAVTLGNLMQALDKLERINRLPMLAGLQGDIRTMSRSIYDRVRAAKEAAVAAGVEKRTSDESWATEIEWRHLMARGHIAPRNIEEPGTR